MSSYQNQSTIFAKYANDRNWVLGKYGEFYWMNATKLDVLRFLSDIMLDAIKNYADKGLISV